MKSIRQFRGQQLLEYRFQVTISNFSGNHIPTQICGYGCSDKSSSWIWLVSYQLGVFMLSRSEQFSSKETRLSRWFQDNLQQDKPSTLYRPTVYSQTFHVYKTYLAFKPWCQSGVAIIFGEYYGDCLANVPPSLVFMALLWCQVARQLG